MTAHSQADTWSIELRDRIIQLRAQTMRFASVGLFVLGVTLLGSVTLSLDPVRSLLAAAALFALIGIVWLVRRWSYPVAACLLITGLDGRADLDHGVERRRSDPLPACPAGGAGDPADRRSGGPGAGGTFSAGLLLAPQLWQ